MVGRMRYAPTIGYVRSFEIPMQFSNWVRVRVQKMDLYTPPSVTYGGAYAIRPYNRVRAILRNTDAISRPGTCCPSKNCPVFVSFGAVCGAYSIRPYDRVCAALRKTIPFSSPSGPSVGRMRYTPTTGYVRPFKKLSRFCPLRGRGVGVFDTPLQLDTCDPSKYRCDPPTGYVRFFEIPM